ncbi:MAG: PKD domain-containing protein [Thermoplasmata archaeon]|nr:PKD domain-containing protein [Thermoplasmata archaeon]
MAHHADLPSASDRPAWAPAAIPAAPALTNASPPKWFPGPTNGPPPRVDSGYASDPSTGLSVIFGGYQNTTPPCPLASSCTSQDTWVLSGGVWRNVTPASLTATNSPSVRFGAALSYDAAISRFVLFGGAGATPSGLNNPALGDTWTFAPSNDTWTQVCQSCTAGTDAPPARWDSGFAYDPAAQETVVFGGLTTFSGTTVGLSDTWTFDGTNWTAHASGATPVMRSSPAMAWDGQSQSIIMVGGVPTSAATGRTWSFSSGNWTMQSPTTSPPQMGGAAAATNPLNGSPIIYGGCASNPCSTGSLNQTWTYSNGNWYRLFPALRPAPVGRDHAALFDLGPLGALGMFGGDARGAPSNDTWYLYTVQVDQVEATPTTVDIGQSVTLHVNVTGGAGYESYRWINLPTGCASQNFSTLSCQPSPPGPYLPNIRAIVTDQIGQSVYAPAALVHFNADPAVTLSASPMAGIVPLQASFLATASGGTGPISYQWRFGDQGVGIGPNPYHIYLSAGNFTATVWANDSLGYSSHSSIAVSAIALLGVNLAISPVNLQVGNTSVIAVTGYGGIGPYTYAFSGLPNGCVNRSSNVSACTLTQAGSYPFSVTVTDHSGQSMRKDASLTVSAAPPSRNTNPATSYLNEFLLGGAIAAGVLVGLLILLLVRRRRRAAHPRPTTTVPVPEPHEVPALGGSLYIPPPERSARRKP